MRNFLIISGCLFSSSAAIANVEKITVYGHRTGLIGDAISASSGIIGQGEIDERPMLRSSEMWTNTSLSRPSTLMKPKPRSRRQLLMYPFAIVMYSKKLFYFEKLIDLIVIII